MSDEYYVPLQEAFEMLRSRAHLVPIVEEWWWDQGWTVSNFPHAGGAGCLARQLATFRYEDALFQEMNRIAGLVPVWCPYQADKFSGASSLKKSYIRPLFCSGRGRNGGLKIDKPRLIRGELQNFEGVRLENIKLDSGTSLVDFHRSHLQTMVPGAVVHDVSDTLVKIGRPQQYYRFDMSLYVSHVVLFEDYHGGESGNKLDSFTTGIFEPAFHEIKAIFGVKPLIVRLPWCQGMGYYPADSNWREHSILDKVLEQL